MSDAPAVDEDAVCRDYEAGSSLRGTALKHGLTFRAVRRIITDRGIEIRRPNTFSMSGVSDEDLCAALRKCGGNKAAAGRAVGLSRTAVFYRVEENPALADIVAEEKESRKDEAEELLVERMRTEWPALKYFLATQCKDRGYSERQEVTGADGERIVVEFERVYPDADAEKEV